MARLTIEDLATHYPYFRISVRVVSGKRLYHLDHGPSQKGSACTLRTLADVESVILGFARNQHNTSYWRPECFLADVEAPAAPAPAPEARVVLKCDCGWSLPFPVGARLMVACCDTCGAPSQDLTLVVAP